MKDERKSDPEVLSVSLSLVISLPAVYGPHGTHNVSVWKRRKLGFWSHSHRLAYAAWRKSSDKSGPNKACLAVSLCCRLNLRSSVDLYMFSITFIV